MSKVQEFAGTTGVSADAAVVEDHFSVQPSLRQMQSRIQGVRGPGNGKFPGEPLEKSKKGLDIALVRCIDPDPE